MNEDGPNTLAQVLQRELAKRDWSGRTLAKEARVSQTAIARALREENTPGPETIRKIACALEVDETYSLRLAGHVEAEPLIQLDPAAAYIARRISALPPKTRKKAVNAVGSVVDAFWDMSQELAVLEQQK